MTDISTIILIPKPLTPLIGRDAELDDVLELLRGGSRLVTITGIGGIGKTRLAHQVALEIEPHLNARTAIVQLSAIRDSAQILPEIAKVLGRTEAGIDIRAMESLLGTDPQLLVLDNLEQIPDAGSVIAELLASVPELVVVATSQVPLDIAGEQRYPLEPMGLETTGDKPHSAPAVQLFVTRALAVNPHLQFDDTNLATATEICQLLDGIPLAIELAAARLAIFSLTELRDRLENRLDVLGGRSASGTERHRTMRNAIAWSYELLDSDTARLFRYLSVYPGGLGVESIEHTLNTLEITDELLDVISALVSRGFIRRQPVDSATPRYQMLQTLRDYAAEQLQAEGDEFRAHLAQAMYFTHLAEKSEPELSSPQQISVLHQLGVEQENILHAATWASQHRPELALRMTAALQRFIESRGNYRDWISIARAAMNANISQSVEARGWWAIGSMEVKLRDDLGVADHSIRQAIERSQQVGDTTTEALSHIALGTIALYEMNLDAARERYEKARTLAIEHGALPARGMAMANLGLVDYFSQNHDKARTHLLEAIPIFEQLGDISMLTRLYSNLGPQYTRLGEPLIAKDYLTKSVEISRQMSHGDNLRFALEQLGNANLELGDYDAAKAAYDEGIEISRRSRQRVSEMESLTMSLSLPFRKKDWLGTATIANAALSIPTGDETTRATCACATTLLLMFMETGSTVEAASLWGGVSRWVDEKVYSIPAVMAAQIEKFWKPFADRTDSAEWQAFNQGRNYTKQELQHYAAQLAQNFIEAARESGAAPSSDPVETPESLTAREREVLGLVAQGLSNREIADAMFVSVRTATTHVSNILAKLNAKNRSSAVAMATSSGIL